jgi:hypothetical protein
MFPKKEGGTREMTKVKTTNKIKERRIDNDSHGTARHQIEQRRNHTARKRGGNGAFAARTGLARADFY